MKWKELATGRALRTILLDQSWGALERPGIAILGKSHASKMGEAVKGSSEGVEWIVERYVSQRRNVRARATRPLDRKIQGGKIILLCKSICDDF